MEGGFDFKDTDLLEYYDLNNLNPSESWINSSTKSIDLSKWQDTEPTVDNSYDIIRDIISQQQKWKDDNDVTGSNYNKDLVQDPLNNHKMMELLNYYHVPQDDQAVFFINSKKFNVIKYLKTIHEKDTFEDLSRSLDNLDMNLQSQSNELKSLVQNNFTKYVKVKNRLDKIYETFSNNKSRGIGTPSTITVDDLNEKLEEEVRMTNLKLKPLLDSSRKLSNYQLMRAFVEENKDFLACTKRLRVQLEKKDYKSLMMTYSKALKTYDEMRKLYNKPNMNTPMIITKVWTEVERIMEAYKNQIWENLIEMKGNDQGVFLPLISKLLNLELKQENFILQWIMKRLERYELKVNEISTDMREKIISFQKSIKANFKGSDKDSINVDLSFYKSINRGMFFTSDTDTEHELQKEKHRNKSIHQISPSVMAFQGLTDSTIIVEMWLLLLRYINILQCISSQFIEFWEHVEKFLDGTYQNSLLNDIKKENILIGSFDVLSQNKENLFLEANEVKKIKAKGELMIQLLSKKILSLFRSTQAEMLPNINDAEIDDANDRKHSESIEEYGFIPPYANGLSCLRYLPKIVNPILKFATELAQLGISHKSIETLRIVANVTQIRSIGSLSAVKLRDISNFYTLENWQVFQTVRLTTEKLGPTEYGVTQFPEIARGFQEYSIETVRDLLFSFEKLPLLNGISIVGYPEKSLLNQVEAQQIVSMESVLEAILKNATKDKDSPRNSHTILTLTNLQFIRENTFPQTLQYFDEAFEWNLSHKKLELLSLLSKMEQSIFGNYLSDLKINLRDVLEVKFKEISWATYTSSSFRISDYIIEGLMVLVTVHSECFRIGPQLISKILQETQVFISKYLFESFKPFVGNISSDGLLQITVDLQFFQLVLNNLLENDTKVTLNACLQNCFQNDLRKLRTCIEETETIVNSNLSRTSIQFAAFK